MNGDPILTSAGNPFFYGGNPLIEGKAVTGFTCDLSMLTAEAFISNPSIDLSLLVGLGYKLTIRQGGLDLIGWIKAAGSGETYGSELVTNPLFSVGSPPSNWTPTRGALASETGAGNYNTSPSAKLTVTPGQANGNFYQLITVPVNTLMIADVYLKNGDATSLGWKLQGNIAGIMFENTGLTPSAMTKYTDRGTLINYGGNTGVFFYPLFVYGDGKYGYADDCSLKKILTPSVSGVTIKTAADDNTENWTSDGGIDPNAASFTLTITKS